MYPVSPSPTVVEHVTTAATGGGVELALAIGVALFVIGVLAIAWGSLIHKNRP